MHASWPYPFLVAHRGGGTSAPENTLAGFRLAAARGFRMVEFDVMLSADAQCVLIHDETLERTTDGHGRVCDYPLAALQGLNAAQGWPALPPEPVPTLTEALHACAAMGLMVNVEIKPAQGFDIPTGAAVGAVLADTCYPAAAPLVSSFSVPALQAARERAPALPRALLFDQVPTDWLERLTQVGAQALHCNAAHVPPELVRQAARAGIAVLCYTVNDVDQMRRLKALGVRGVFTDRMDFAARFP